MISLYGRTSLLAVHCYSRYAFTLFDISRWEWDDLPGTFLIGLRQSFPNTGILDAVTDHYLRYAGAPRITKTHGRREVSYLAWEDVLSIDYTLDQTTKIQLMLDHAMNARFKDIYPEILEKIKEIVDGNTYGSPEKVLSWTTLSLHDIQRLLFDKYTIKVSYRTVGNLLEKLGSSKQTNQKMLQVGTPNPNRSEQFEHINNMVKNIEKRTILAKY